MKELCSVNRPDCTNSVMWLVHTIDFAGDSVMARPSCVQHLSFVVQAALDDGCEPCHVQRFHP